MDRELSILFRHHTEVEALRVKQLTKDPSFAVEGGKLVFDKIDCSVSGMHPPDNWAAALKQETPLEDQQKSVRRAAIS